VGDVETVVLVTGGSRGIGRGIALAFAEPGVKVAVNFRGDAAAADDVVAEVARRGGEAMAVRADVTDLDQVRSMVDAVVARFGEIGVLVNNAGGTRDGLLAMMEREDWQSVLDLNLTSVFYCCRIVARRMMAERRGAIVNVSSLSGITGLPGQTNYAAAKGGVIAFTRALAQEVARFGIRVNAVAPGLIETDMAAKLTELDRDRLLSAVPLKRMGTPEEVGRVVRFLASDGASYITGETIKVTGGI